MVGSLVSWGGVFLGVTVVFHVSDVTVIVSLVGDGLVATVGEGNVVRSSDVLAVAGLRVAKVVVVLILNFVVEAVRLGSLPICKETN